MKTYRKTAKLNDPFEVDNTWNRYTTKINGDGLNDNATNKLSRIITPPLSNAEKKLITFNSYY